MHCLKRPLFLPRVASIQTAGFSSPTPIQAQTWPIALQSRDILAIAKTGSGKTLGYLLPAFIHLRRCQNNSQVGPTVLILAPTQELATQIHDEAIKFGRSSSVSCTARGNWEREEGEENGGEEADVTATHRAPASRIQKAYHTATDRLHDIMGPSMIS
ncbi:dead-box atp-dependent rna helicase 40 [Cinnamomum micranthum f. kanehirae]|uniref:Dead-box atp-dependent rna helicase 40 n=1 Tax=Cinnamomum micranthum f. kanehirae TaxID=337451 RepID=A0A443NCV5_9MAGN|nr:dead-box atp-dependent rna helicase 40 [Cinnamomum micranthum f. kanehirae]